MKIKEIASFNPKGKKPNDYINYVDTSSVEDGKLIGLQTLSKDIPSRAQRVIEKNDILISSVRPILKHNFFVGQSIQHGVASTGFIQIRVNNSNVLPRFLYYYLTVETKVQQYQTIAETSQSTFPSFNKDVIEEMEFPNISLETQQHIVDILGSIDEKIESNNKIIEKNNTIMRLLFSNFYEKIKLSSETVPIGSLELTVSDFVANGSFASLKENVEILDNLSYAYFIRNTDLKAGAFNKFVSEDAYRFLAKSALYGHEVLISNVGDVGSVFLCPKLNKPMTLGNNMIFINSKGKDYYNYYLFFLFSSEEGQYLIRGITGGSAQPKFNKTDFRNIMVYNPSAKLLADFNKNVEVYLNRNTLCHSENLNLNRLKQLYLKKFFG